jgi:uncharacterized protein (TIGR02001 family)
MIKQTALVVAALAAGVSAQAQAAEASALSVTVDVTYVSDYVFRATQLANASIQPSVEAAYGDFYAGIWASDGISDASGSEADLYAGYGLAIDDTFSADVGVTRYTYQGGSAIDTTEAFVGVSADVLLTPSVYAYYDFDLDNTTLELSVGYSLPVDAIKTSLDFSAAAGYVDLGSALAGTPDDYTYYSVGVAVPYKLSETATLTAGVDYVYNNEDTVAGFNGGDNDILVGKVGISIGF